VQIYSGLMVETDLHRIDRLVLSAACFACGIRHRAGWRRAD
jgi:hypothetical protein